jgi:cyclophilin family peptidyl-prolyl cis-trans isomerase
MRTWIGVLAVALSALSARGPAGEPAKNPVVVVKTSLGEFEVELYQDKSPITVKNFLAYVEDKYYDGTIFHRVMDDFMIQGGGFTKDGQKKETKAPIKNESGNGVKNVNYAIAMARTDDLNSATSQFYINVKDNDFLDDNKYCAFGMVIKGREVIDKIKGVKVNKPGQLSAAQPVEPVVIESARVKAAK